MHPSTATATAVRNSPSAASFTCPCLTLSATPALAQYSRASASGRGSRSQATNLPPGGSASAMAMLQGPGGGWGGVQVRDAPELWLAARDLPYGGPSGSSGSHCTTRPGQPAASPNPQHHFSPAVAGKDPHFDDSLCPQRLQRQGSSNSRALGRTNTCTAISQHRSAKAMSNLLSVCRARCARQNICPWRPTPTARQYLRTCPPALATP